MVRTKTENVGRKPWKAPRGEPSKADYALAFLLAAGAEQADIAAARGVSANAVAKAAQVLRTNTRARTTLEAVYKLSLVDPARFRAGVKNAHRVLEEKFSAQISATNGHPDGASNPLQSGGNALSRNGVVSSTAG